MAHQTTPGILDVEEATKHGLCARKVTQIISPVLASMVVYDPDASVSGHLGRSFCFQLYNYHSFICPLRGEERTACASIGFSVPLFTSI